jgi:hypothetical protein
MKTTILMLAGALAVVPSLAFAQSSTGSDTTTTGSTSGTVTPMSEADCTAWMTRVDANADGSLATTEATPFIEKMTSMNMQPTTAGTLTREEFMRECQAGNFTGIPMTTP